MENAVGLKAPISICASFYRRSSGNARRGGVQQYLADDSTIRAPTKITRSMEVTHKDEAHLEQASTVVQGLHIEDRTYSANAYIKKIQSKTARASLVDVVRECIETDRSIADNRALRSAKTTLRAEVTLVVAAYSEHAPKEELQKLNLVFAQRQGEGAPSTCLNGGIVTERGISPPMRRVSCIT